MGYSIFDETMVDMTWPEIEKAAEQGSIVLLPIGIIEEHGPHMGLAVDTYIAYLVSKLAKHELDQLILDQKESFSGSIVFCFVGFLLYILNSERSIYR